MPAKNVSASKPAKKAAAKASPAKTNAAAPLMAMPQSKAAAATAAGVNLKTDDSWSTPYWTDGDLHYRERTLFG